MDNRMWYYLRESEQIGPVGVDELLRLLDEGTITPDTYIWAEGMPEWLPAGQVAELGGRMTPAGLAGQLPPPGAVRPTSVTAFGILNIIFGGLGLLCTPVALLPFFLPAKMQAGAEMGPGMKAYLLVSIVIGFFANILLVSTGIGLLNLKRWARQWSCYYGWFAIVMGVVGITITILMSASNLQGATEERMAGEIGGLIGGMCGGIIGLIYPIFLIVYMRRPNVIEACQR